MQEIDVNEYKELLEREQREKDRASDLRLQMMQERLHYLELKNEQIKQKLKTPPTTRKNTTAQTIAIIITLFLSLALPLLIILLATF